MGLTKNGRAAQLPPCSSSISFHYVFSPLHTELMSGPKLIALGFHHRRDLVVVCSWALSYPPPRRSMPKGKQSRPVGKGEAAKAKSRPQPHIPHQQLR